MKSFTIHEIERLSGVKAHNLRSWEHRYHILIPLRSGDYTRRYTVDDLKLILDISLLRSNGCKVSKLAVFTPTAIRQKVALLSTNEAIWQRTINNLIVVMYNRQGFSFDDVLTGFLEDWPVDVLVEQVLYPFLKITRLLWLGHRLCEEHEIVTASRRKIILAIENQLVSTVHSSSVVLFLPDSRQLDLGLLFLHYFLKSRGIKVCYLGTDVSLTNIKTSIEIYEPSFLYTYLYPKTKFPVDQLLTFMSLQSPLTKLIVGEYVEFSNTILQSPNLLRLKFDESLLYLENYCETSKFQNAQAQVLTGQGEPPLIQSDLIAPQHTIQL